MQPSPTTQESRSNATRQGSVLGEALAIAIGGALGASLRFAIGLGMQLADLHSAWATLTVNPIGAFLLGVIVARIASPSAHPLLRPFLVVGVLGSFTTFSALAFDNRQLATQQGELLAALHLVGSIATGIVAFSFGTTIARGRG